MPEKNRDLGSLFEAALKIESADERKEFVERSCGDSEILRRQLLALLQADEESEGFLSQPPSGLDVTQLHAGQAVGSEPPARQSILKLIEQSVEVPRVVLDSSPGEGHGPIVRATSKEMPKVERDERYQLHGEIARGGMGAILKGRDIDLGRDLAVKVLLEEHRQKPAVIQRFVEEAQIGGQLQHPGIVPVYELGQFQDRRPFFTMKLVKGKTLAALLSERKSIEDDRTKFLGIFEQVCQTMAYAHSRGVIHRDLKPSNVMVGAFGEVQVMDWGLAKVLAEGGVVDEKRANDNRTSMSIIQTIRSLGSDTPAGIGTGGTGSHTQMGSVMGTPAYMAPEQALGEIDRLDERCDVFGLGSILCEILTGGPPYTGEDHVEVFRKASRAKLEECFDRLQASGVDSDLVQLINDCLEPEPDDRLRDAGVLSERVTAHMESVENRLRAAELARVEADTRAIEERKRRKVFMALAASTLLTLLVAGGGWMWVQEKEAAIERATLQRRNEVEQLVRGELSSARALANVKSAELPSVQAVGRALAAVSRAEASLADDFSDSTLASETRELRYSLENMHRDLNLVANLEKAWQTEMEQIAASRDTSTGPASQEITDSAEHFVPDAASEYEQSFAAWGLSPNDTDQNEAAKRINSMHPSLQPTVFVSLDRWYTLLSRGPTIAQWQQRPWTTLRPIDLKSHAGDRLTLLEDQSILAKGPHGYAGYDLVFATDETKSSALRLEALPDNSLPHKGPGRCSDGSFRVERQQVWIAPKSDPHAQQPVKFRDAVASYHSPMTELTPDFWHVDGRGEGTPHVAVFEFEETLNSDSGFIITIKNADQPRRSDGKDILALGRFRWSVNAEPRPLAKIEWLAGLSKMVDGDPWRAALRKEMMAGDLDAIMRRIEDEAAFRSQPKMVLIQLANYLQSVPGRQLLASLSETVNWEVFPPDRCQLELEAGVKSHLAEDDSISFSGYYPNTETISITAPVAGKPIRAVRLELLTEPHFQSEVPSLSRRREHVALAEAKGWLAASGDRADETEVEFQQVVSDYDGPMPLGHAVDGDDLSFTFIKGARQARTIVFLLDDYNAEKLKFLRFQTTTVDSTCLARIRLSVTRDEIAIPNPQTVALALLQRLNNQNPRDYWIQLALADAMQRQVPPRSEDALRHATAAVALRPEVAASHEAVLRSVVVSDLAPSSSSGEIALAHAIYLREMGRKSHALRELLNTYLQDADRLADEQNEQLAVEKYEFVVRLDPATPKVVDEAASGLRSNRKYPEAVQAYEQAISLNPKSALLHNGLGLVYSAMRKPNEAISQYERAIEVEPTFTAAHRNLAGELGKLGNSAEAINILKVAIETAPVDPENYSYLARTYDGIGNTQKAIEWYGRALEVDPYYSNAYRSLAAEYRADKAWDKVIEVLDQAVTAAPHDADNHLALGQAHAAQRRWDDAIHAFRRAVELVPYHSYYLSHLAGTLGQQNRIEEAIQVWQDCIPLVPHETYPLNNLAVLLQNSGRLDEAIDAYQKVVEIDPQAGYISYTNLAFALTTAGRFDEAVEVYRKTIQQHPDEGNAYTQFARFLKRREEFDEAEQLYRRAIELGTTPTSSFNELAAMLKKQDQIDEAIEVRLQQITKTPHVAEAYDELSRLLRQQRRHDEVIPIFRKAIKDQPDNASLIQSIGWALARDSENSGHFPWALGLAKRAAELRPGEYEALDVLALSQYRAGNYQLVAEIAKRANETEQRRTNWTITLPVTLERRAMRHCWVAMSAFQLGRQDEARRYIRKAEQELGPLAFCTVEESDGFDDVWSSGRDPIAFLSEARELMGEQQEFTDQEAVDNTLEALFGYLDTYPDDPFGATRTAALLGWVGRRKEHRELSGRALKSLSASDDADAFHLAAESFLLIPSSDEELRGLAAEAARTAVKKVFHPAARPWGDVTTGMSEFRQGDFVKAEEIFTKVCNIGGYNNNSRQRFTIALFWRSMASHKLGKYNEARADFERAKSRMKPQKIPSRDKLKAVAFYHNPLKIWLAYEEAKALLDPPGEESDATTSDGK